MRDSTKVVAFGEYALDFGRGELRHREKSVDIQPTPLRLLLYLAEHRDRVVPRPELLDTVWPGVVVGDEALTTALAEARHAVGDDGAAQRVIRTYKGRGYRFVAGVTESSIAAATRADSEPLARPRRLRGAVVLGVTGAAIAAAMVAVVGVAFRSLLRPRGALPRAIESPSVVVLPFVNLSGVGSDQPLADGATDQFIDGLASRGLTVVARPSILAWKKRESDVRELARSLDATHVLDGSVRRAGARVRVTARLSLGESGVQLWSGFEEAEASDPLAVPDKLTKRLIRRALTQFLFFTPEGKRLVAGTDPRIWPLLVEMQVQASQEQFDRALATSERIRAIDPDHAATHAWRIHLWGTAAVQGKIPREEAERGIRASTAALLQHAPDNAVSLNWLARAYEFDWNWADAESSARRACELESQQCLSLAFVCMALGCLDESLRISQAAVHAQPEDDLTWGYFRALSLVNAGRYEEAKRASLRAVELNWERSASFLGMGLIDWHLGEKERAVDAMRRWYPRHDSAVEVVEAIDRERAAGGPEAVMRWLAKELSRDDSGPARIFGARNHFVSALHWLALGENERALEQLEMAADRREGEMSRVVASASCDPIRDTPRFKALIEKMGLTAYHAKYLPLWRAASPTMSDAPPASPEPAR